MSAVQAAREALQAAEALAARARESYAAYTHGPDCEDGDHGEHVVDWSVAADASVDAAHEAVRAAIADTIEVGDVDEVYTGDDRELADMTGDLAYCVGLSVSIDGDDYPVACMVGIHESEQGSARASGAGTSYGGGPSVWWADASDWQSLPVDLRDAVLGRLNNAARRLLRQAEEICEEELEDRREGEDDAD